MSKILGSWSGMRKYLEKEMLAESLQGRVRYGCTHYAGMDGSRFFELCIDSKQVKCFSWETVNSYFIKNGYKRKRNPVGKSEYWEEFWSLLNQYTVTERTEYTDEEFCDALERYRNQDIQKSLRSDHPIVKMFAILDRRVGKRTLEKIKDECGCEPLWLQQIFFLRFEAEQISFL